MHSQNFHHTTQSEGRTKLMIFPHHFDTMRFLLWIALLVMVVGSDTILAHRFKRHVAFKKGSTFFERVNYKTSSVPWSPNFFHATGFKVAWPLPDGTRARRSIDELHSSAALMYESYGLNGQSCLYRNICEAFTHVRHKDGVVAKILKLLASASNSNWTPAEDLLLKCDQHKAACPLHLIGVDSFTEM